MSIQSIMIEVARQNLNPFWVSIGFPPTNIVGKILPIIIPNSRKINRVLMLLPRVFGDAKSIAHAKIEGELNPDATPNAKAERKNKFNV